MENGAGSGLKPIHHTHAMQPAETQPALWQQDECLRDLRARLAVCPLDIRVVSFDFFDTLVCRLCAEPADLFIEVGRRLAAAGLLKLQLSPEGFHNVRVAADEKARRLAISRGGSVEINLDAIYEQLAAVVTDRAAARRVEFETERDFCFLNPSIASLVEHVRALGLKVALISDTYFTRAELCQLLADNGFSPALFDQMFVSNEAGCAKWDGRLFLKACAHFGIHPNELLHIGDNPHADVEMACRLGAGAVHYPAATGREADSFTRERLLSAPAKRRAASLNAIRTLCSRLARDEKDAFRDGAFVFGPVLSLYADWCVQQFKAAGVTKVLALMREGELLGELVDRAARADGVELKVEPCFVSRLSTARASLAGVSAAAIAELLEGSPTLTLHNVLEILGVLDDVRDRFREEVLHKQVPSAVAMMPLLEHLMAQKQLVGLIAKRCKEAHALAFEYLDGLTCGETNIGFLDLGWSGSIQRNVLRILRNGGRQVRGVGCYVATTRRAGRAALDGDVIHAYLDCNWNRNTILAEVAINASIGSTNGYARDKDGQVVPVLGQYEAAPEERQIKQRVRDGVLAFQTFWLSVSRRRSPGACSRSGGATGQPAAARITPSMRAELDQQAATILIRLIEHPGVAEARRLGNLTHDENYWDRRYSRPLCSPEAERHLEARGVGDFLLEAKCYWPQGVVARRYPRLIAALSRQWADPLALGRLGATRNTAAHDTCLTEEERASLIELLQHFGPRQVIFAGRAAVAMESDFATLIAPGRQTSGNPEGAATADSGLPATGDAPVLISFARDPVGVAWHYRVEGEPTGRDSLRAVRAMLQPAAPHALVLTSEFDADTVTSLLSGLAPFLGAGGVILARCGDSDLVDSMHEHGLTKTVGEWLRRNGAILGYGLWKPADGVIGGCRNWTVLARGRPRESQDYWQITLSDLPLGARFGGALWQPARQPEFSPAAAA